MMGHCFSNVCFVGAVSTPTFVDMHLCNTLTLCCTVVLQAWMAPISIAGGFDSCMGVPGSTIREWKQELSEASADELRPGIFKLGLASVSAAVVYGLVWLTCLAQLGGHSLAGWLLVGLLVVWRAVIWVWDLVLWDPPAGYPLQVGEDPLTAHTMG